MTHHWHSNPSSANRPCQDPEENVPTYQYACTACGHQLEAVQSFADEPLTECPSCEGRLRKLFNSVGIVFKGSGFYRTDSRSNGSGSSSRDDSKPAASGGGDSAAKGGSGNGSNGGGSTDGASAGKKDGASTKPKAAATSGTSSASSPSSSGSA